MVKHAIIDCSSKINNRGFVVKEIYLSCEFSQELLKTGYNLTAIGISEIAWKCEDALNAINFLADRGYAILGGDVYMLNNGDIEPTCDSWYINKSANKCFIDQSRKAAIEYITQYTSKNGDGFVYSIVFEKIP